MKKFALALMASAALVFGFGVVAQAQSYGTVGISFSPPNPAPGETVTVTITGCTPGEVITITLDGNVVATATCGQPAALQGSLFGIGFLQQAGTTTATATFTAPDAPGTYAVAVTGDQDYSVSESLTVAAADTTTTTVAGTTVPPTVPGGGLPPTNGGGEGGGLPATGSDGIGATTGIAIGLLAVGLGLFAVAQVRRRQTAPVA